MSPTDSAEGRAHTHTQTGGGLTVFVLVVGAPAHHVGHVLRLLVDGRDPQQGSLRWVLADQQLHGGGLGQLAVELVEKLRELRRHKQRAT